MALPLGGFLSTSSMGMSIGGTKLVHCREVVHFSEGPLLEVLLYIIYKSAAKKSMNLFYYNYGTGNLFC